MKHLLVSVGLPVFNGEASVARCIEALLAQDYPSVEIIISDNASTDRTQEICEHYVSLHRQIRYIRQPQNAGVIGNFSSLIEQASGEYFMWAAHDDTRDPRFIRACVDKLQAEPGAVLCQAHTNVVMESSGELLCINRLDSVAGPMPLGRRYWEVLRRFPMTGIYGVYRTAAVQKTCRLTQTIASDVSFIRELSLNGHFTQVDQRLFTYRIRDHWNDVQQDYRVFTGGRGKPFWYIPFLALFVNDARKVWRSEHSIPAKLQLTALLVAALAVDKGKRLLVWAVRAGSPRSLQPEIASRVYWGMLHNHNVEVVSHPVYLRRIIMPIVLS